MKYQKILLPVILVNLAALTALAFQLPESVPMHINIAGEIDRWGTRWAIPLLGLLPLLLFGGILLYKKRTAANPQVGKNKKVEGIILAVVILFTTVITWTPMAVFQMQQTQAQYLPMELIVGLPLGVMLMIMGNYMGVIKQNKFLGVRTKWTLSNEEVWRETHRKAAYWGVSAGIILVISCIISFLLKMQVIALVGLIVSIFLTAIVPLLYSRWLYKKLEHKQD